MKMQKVLGTMKDIVTSSITRGAVQGALEAYAKRPAKRGSRVTSTLLVLGIGLVVGSVVTLMLAPMSGSDLRNKLMSFAKKAKTEAKEAIEGEAQAGAQPDGAKPAGTNSHSRRSPPT